jgi:hypothetical protein
MLHLRNLTIGSEFPEKFTVFGGSLWRGVNNPPSVFWWIVAIPAIKRNAESQLGVLLGRTRQRIGLSCFWKVKWLISLQNRNHLNVFLSKAPAKRRFLSTKKKYLFAMYRRSVVKNLKISNAVFCLYWFHAVVPVVRGPGRGIDLCWQSESDRRGRRGFPGPSRSRSTGECAGSQSRTGSSGLFRATLPKLYNLPRS